MEFTARDFAALFGVAENALPGACRAIASASDFHYEVPAGPARVAIVESVREHIESNRPTRVGEPRAGIWEASWAENKQRFVDGGFDPERLVPDFIKPGQPMRLRRAYIVPRNPRFELDFFRVCRAWLFERFFRDLPSVYEFGCGSGFNLIALHKQMPGKKLCGLDWSKSSNQMVELFRDKLGMDAGGRQFDFFNPDRSLQLGPGAGVLTVCALEQVGPRHGPFVDYLLENRPAICVSLEPLLELYDAADPVDELAIRFHRKRGYLEGYLGRLRELAAARRVEIVGERRFEFGSLYHECYSFVAWRPL